MAAAAGAGSESKRAAFEVETVINNLEVVVTALGYHERSLYLGTSKGELMLYRLEQSGSRVTGRAIERHDLPEKKKVDQLEVVPGLNHILVLCNGSMTVHQFSLELVPSAISVKNATMFCVNQKNSVCFQLCVARKRSLHLYEYSQGSFKFTIELAIPDTPIAMVWYGHKFCICCKREYNLVNDQTGEVEDLPCELDSRATPLIKLMPEEVLLVAVSDQIGMHFAFDATPAPRGAIQWTSAPQQVAYCFPYVISLMPKTNTLEVHSWRNQAFVQSIGVDRGASCLIDGRTGTEDDESKGQNFVFFAGRNSICRLRPVSFDKQVEQLLREKQLEEAQYMIQNTNSSSLRVAKMQRFHIDAGRRLFLDLEFEAAVYFLQQTSATFDPRELLMMYPSFLPPATSYNPRYFNATLLQAIANGEKTARDAVTPDVDDVDGDAVRKPPVPELSAIVLGVLRSRGAGSTAMEVDRYVNESHAHLITFLQDRRKRFRGTDADVDMCVDTALLKLYAKQRLGTRLEDFLAQPNAVHLATAEAFLRSRPLHHVLARLYRSRGMAKEALSIWAVPQDGLDGLDDTISYLSELDDPVLILQFAARPLREAPEKAMRIFTAATRRTPLKPDEVLQFLQVTPLEAAARSAYIQKYLEYIINDCNNVEERFHTLLAQEYLHGVTSLRETTPEADADAPHSMRPVPGEEPGALGVVRGKLMKLLKQSNSYDVHALLEIVQETTLYEERVVLHSKAKQHEPALRLLVYDLANTAQAEEYCVAHSPGPTPEQDPFMILLRLYFGDTDRRVAFRGSAMRLLRTYAKRIDPVQVLRLLPGDIHLQDLAQYLQAVVPHSAHRVRHAQIVSQLYKIENIRVSAKLVKERSRDVQIHSDSMCVVCGLRLGDRWFAVYPDNTIVHASCVPNKDPTVHPLTGEKFEVRR